MSGRRQSSRIATAVSSVASSAYTRIGAVAGGPVGKQESRTRHLHHTLARHLEDG